MFISEIFENDDDMFADRWYDDSKVQKMIQQHFTPTIGTTRAYELGLDWVNLVSDPDAVGRTEMLSINNNFAEKHNFPFRFKNFKWDGNDGEVYWVLTGGIPPLKEEDDMFAPSWRITVIHMLRKMLESAALQNKFEIEAPDLEDIQRLIAALQTGNIDNAKKVWSNFDLDELDNVLYLYVVRSHPNIDLYQLLGNEEDFLEEEDMFASPFRVVRDVMDWQRTAARKFGTRGMRSLKLPNTIVFYVKQEDGAVKGAYYSPQPASDDTNIGTYNKNFNGTIEQYMKQDPHNPLNQLSEEEDMFAGTTVGTVMKWYNKLDELCDETGHSADELLRFDSDTWSHLYTTVEDGGYPAIVISIANEEQRRAIINDIKGFISDIQQASGINESDDDMFTTGPNLSQKLGDALLRYGDGVLMYADDLKTSNDPDTRDYVSELMSKGAAFVRAGKAFDAKGLQAGIMEWVLIDREYRDEFYNYIREVEDWNPEELINGHLGLNEEAAGVGVVSNSKDPRYVMATMGDQNDVDASTLPKMMKAYSLIGKKAKKR
jgi:hypothetical protein